MTLALTPNARVAVTSADRAAIEARIPRGSVLWVGRSSVRSRFWAALTNTPLDFYRDRGRGDTPRSAADAVLRWARRVSTSLWRVIDCPFCGGFSDCPACNGGEVLWIRPSGHLFLYPGGPARGKASSTAWAAGVRAEVLHR